MCQSSGHPFQLTMAFYCCFYFYPVAGVYKKNIPILNDATRSTQPCIPPGWLNRVPVLSGRGKGENVTSVGWQVTLRDGGTQR